jgi:hypothetical protein
MDVRETIPELKNVRNRHAQAIADAEARGAVNPEIAATIRAIVAKFDNHIADIAPPSR